MGSRNCCPGPLRSGLACVLLSFDCAWKKDVVFEMDVLVQVLLKCRERFIKGLVADADVRRNSIVVRYSSQFPQYLAGGVVLHHHHADWIVNGAKRRERQGHLENDCTR